MDDVVERRLTSAGIDVKGALERFMGNEALLVRFLKKFPEDPGCRNLTGAIARADMEGAIAAVHTLKGLCANLSLVTLSNLFARQLELLRAGDLKSAADMMPEVEAAYAQATEAILECLQ